MCIYSSNKDKKYEPFVLSQQLKITIGFGNHRTKPYMPFNSDFVHTVPHCRFQTDSST